MSEILRDEFFDLGHRLDGLGDDLTASIGDFARAARGLVGMPGVNGVLLYGRRDFLQGGGGFFEACRLLFGTLRQIGGARGNVRGRRRHIARQIGNRADRLMQADDRGVEIVADLTVVARKALVQIDRQIAVGQALEAGGKEPENVSLILGHLRPLFGGLSMKLGSLAPLLRRTFCLLSLPRCDRVRFAARLLDGLLLERLDGGRDLADLVLAPQPRQSQIEIAFRHMPDRARDADDRPRNAAADQERDKAADNEGAEHGADQHHLLLLELSIVGGKLVVADVLAGLVQVGGQLLDAGETLCSTLHQHQRSAGIAVGHVDDAACALDVVGDRRFQLTDILGGLGILEVQACEIVELCRDVRQRCRCPIRQVFDLFLVALIGCSRHQTIETDFRRPCGRAKVGDKFCLPHRARHQCIDGGLVALLRMQGIPAKADKNQDEKSRCAQDLPTKSQIRQGCEHDLALIRL